MQGSGKQIQDDFGVANLVQFPITEQLSAAGDGGQPLVVEEPAGPVAAAFGELGAAVVREIAKLSRSAKNSVRFDEELRAFVVRLPSQNGAAAGAPLPPDPIPPPLWIRFPSVVVSAVQHPSPALVRLLPLSRHCSNIGVYSNISVSSL